ncbi:MAG: hypothetical protein JW736_00310 [Deltaproteobacteria bacterium]|nr:hypothetical protein [Deltaproteobacteria bacterium]MBN2688592.1 hypothetical protein [Deltaproteobacteria bacterium]
MKRVWITSLGRDQQKVQSTMAMLKKYALDANGHFWIDDLEKMAWMAARDELIRGDTAAWIILSSPQDIRVGSVRYGLSLLALSMQAVRGHGIPIVFLHDGAPLTNDMLPTPFRGAEILSMGNPAVGAKLVAAANTPVKRIETDYRLDVIALPKLGLWFEVGPVHDAWEGVMFGVNGGEIDFQGVGPKGKLPDRAVLEYPMEGMMLSAGEAEYAAWAVQNELSGDSSYYVRVKGEPSSIIFGPLAGDHGGEVFVLSLT